VPASPPHHSPPLLSNWAASGVAIVRLFFQKINDFFVMGLIFCEFYFANGKEASILLSSTAPE